MNIACSPMPTPCSSWRPARRSIGGGAAVLFDLRGDEKISRVNSHVATHCCNNTGYAHGGHFWLNLYMPLGAKVDGEKSFQKWMKGNRNYRKRPVNPSTARPPALR